MISYGSGDNGHKTAFDPNDVGQSAEKFGSQPHLSLAFTPSRPQPSLALEIASDYFRWV